MTLYVNDKSEVKAVDETEDETLTALPLVDDDNPFDGWSTAKICCYKVGVLPVDDKFKVVMFTPYIITNIIPKIEEIFGAINEGATSVSDLEDALLEISEKVYG